MLDSFVYFQFRGTLRMIFRPLINEMPLIGGMNIFFLSAPVGTGVW